MNSQRTRGWQCYLQRRKKATNHKDRHRIGRNCSKHGFQMASGLSRAQCADFKHHAPLRYMHLLLLSRVTIYSYCHGTFLWHPFTLPTTRSELTANVKTPNVQWRRKQPCPYWYVVSMHQHKGHTLFSAHHSRPPSVAHCC